MSLPTFVFIDTSIFERFGYNFESTGLSSFKSAARDITLLLPAPTEREILRHMRDKCLAVHDEMESLRRSLGFLKAGELVKEVTRSHLVARGNARFRNYLKGFSKVLRLGYEGASLADVMQWYERGDAPFGAGKKKHEFPDAIAVSTLAQHAERHGPIAVVAHDGDFKGACDRYPALHYFDSLPSVTELLLLSDGAKQELLDRAKSYQGNLLSVLKSALPIRVDFEHEASNLFSVRRSTLYSLDLNELNVVGFGPSAFTVTFSVNAQFGHMLGCDDYFVDEFAEVIETHTVTGSAKLTYDKRSATPPEIKALSLDQTDQLVHADPRVQLRSSNQPR